MKRPIALLAVVLFLGTVVAFAQEPTTPQPAQPAAMTPMPAHAVVMAYRCEVKPGHAVAQQKAAAATSRAIAKAPGGMSLLAMSSVTGPSEVWFLMPFDSLADMDKANEAVAKAPAAVQAELDQLNDVEGSHYNAMRSMILIYREDLSLDASFDVMPFRAMSVSTFRVRPGRTREFEQGAKQVMAAYKKIDRAVHFAAFEVLGGAPSGTFIFMRPMKGMAELLPSDEVEKAFVEAMGGQDSLAKIDKGMGEVLAGMEDAVFTFSPKMSAVPASYAKADPYWRITAPAPVKAEAKKEAEQPKKSAEPVKK